MAKALEASGQDMEQEPPDELDSIEGHQPVTVAMGVVLPSKGHPPLLQGQQAPIRDRHAMRITRQILQHLSRPTPWVAWHTPPTPWPGGGPGIAATARMREGVTLPLQRQAPAV